jgi:RNA polymerase sigma-70 factor, ECF subfamily
LGAEFEAILASDDSPLAMVATVDAVSDWAAPAFEEFSTGPVSEGNLAVALWARVKEAHAYVYRQYVPLVAQSCKYVLDDRNQVDDVVQLVFETLWLHPARFDPDRGSLATFLKLQARSRSIDLVRSESSRSQRVRLSNLGPMAMGSAEDDFMATTSKIDLRRLVSLLPAPEREPIELAYFGPMTYRMVAECLGVPEGTVKSRIRSGFSRLRCREGVDLLEALRQHG